MVEWLTVVGCSPFPGGWSSGAIAVPVRLKKDDSTPLASRSKGLRDLPPSRKQRTNLMSLCPTRRTFLAILFAYGDHFNKRRGFYPLLYLGGVDVLFFPLLVFFPLGYFPMKVFNEAPSPLPDMDKLRAEIVWSRRNAVVLGYSLLAESTT
ncbi:unnamed protein product [Cuscuta epithymum]|uniref:Uncharacterized protein n=1 Tax=Cuscuta epithymum TaxID=186058 RepID=A0AAV0E7R8_9ASTE|nr:unnamed protein product [Cuscuta epithymum]